MIASIAALGSAAIWATSRAVGSRVHGAPISAATAR